MWLIPLSEGTLVSEAADCSAGDPSAAAKCKPFRSFLRTGNTVYYYRIIIIIIAYYYRINMQIEISYIA